MIYSLPFHLARYFRPTVLETFEITNTNLGDMFALYGIIALFSYFPGGYLADRFSTRNLMTTALIATGLGGFYMAQIPGPLGLTLLFGYWGLTSVLLFWAALIKATRDWGGDQTQGRAFGFMDGGRGLIAAIFASVGTLILAYFMPSGLEVVNPEDRVEGLKSIIYFYTILTFLGALFVWTILPSAHKNTASLKEKHSLEDVISVLKEPMVWIQGLIIITSYVAFKSLDNYPLYAVDIMGMSEVQSAQFASGASYIRVGGAVIAGLLADRFKASSILIFFFLILIVSFLALSFTNYSPETFIFIYANVLVTFFAVNALRGIYFALLQETKMASHKTGTAVGLISAIGYTPDIFFYSVSARIIAANPGIEGYHDYFTFMAVTVLVGMLATWVLTSRMSLK